MQPIKKRFSKNEPLPFVIDYRQQKGPEHELPDHVQDWFELVYVYEGKGSFFIDHKFYDMEQGNVFIIPANTIHRAVLEQHSSITVTAIFFHGSLSLKELQDESYHPVYLFRTARQSSNYRIALSKEEQSVIEHNLERIQDEFSKQHIGYKSAALYTLQLILIMLSRIVQQGEPTLAPDSVHTPAPGWMKDMLQQLDETDSLGWNLAELARLANVSTSHFSRVFKQLTGMTVTQYLMMKRIIAAKRLLAATDDKLPLIAEQCGFDSIPHFHRCFKSMTSFTPAAYRHMHRNQDHTFNEI